MTLCMAMMASRSKRALVGICVAVVSLVLIVAVVAAFFLYPRMPAITRKGESDLSFSLSPFVINFTENMVVSNPNYIAITVYVRLPFLPSLVRANNSHRCRVVQRIDLRVYHRSIAVGNATSDEKRTFRAMTNGQVCAQLHH